MTEQFDYLFGDPNRRAYEHVVEPDVSAALRDMTFDEIVARCEEEPGEGRPLPTQAMIDAIELEKINAEALRQLLLQHPFRSLIEEIAPFRNNVETSSVEAFLQWCVGAKHPGFTKFRGRYHISEEHLANYVELLGRLVTTHGRPLVDGAVDEYCAAYAAWTDSCEASHRSRLAVRDGLRLTAEAMPHLGSIVVLGYVARCTIDEIDLEAQDPVAYAEGEGDRYEAGLSSSRTSLTQLACCIENEIRRGTGGVDHLMDAFGGMAGRLPPMVTIDPIADEKAMRRPGLSDYWIGGWRMMAERFGADTTVGAFIEAHLPKPAPYDDDSDWGDY